MLKSKKYLISAFGLLLLTVIFFGPLSVSLANAADFSFFKSQNTGLDTGLVPCGNDTGGAPDSSNSIIKDPCQFEDLLKLVNKLMDFAFWIVSFILIGVIAYSGFMYIISQGKPDKVKDSHKRLMAILKGFIWMLCAWLLVYTIQHTLLNPLFYSELLKK